MKKLFSLMIVLCMILGVLPAAFAEEKTTPQAAYTEISGALGTAVRTKPTLSSSQDELGSGTSKVIRFDGVLKITVDGYTSQGTTWDGAGVYYNATTGGSLVVSILNRSSLDTVKQSIINSGYTAGWTSIRGNYVVTGLGRGVAIYAFNTDVSTVMITADYATYAQRESVDTVMASMIGLKAPTLTAKNLKVYASEDQEIYVMPVSTNAGGGMAFTSDTKGVTPHTSGRVTIAAGFWGTAEIKVTSHAHGLYRAATTTFTVTVAKPSNPLALKSSKISFEYDEPFSMGLTYAGSPKLTFTSSTSKVTVSPTGRLIIANGTGGSFTITVTAQPSGVYKRTTKSFTFSISKAHGTIKLK